MVLKTINLGGSVKSWQNNKHGEEINDIPSHFRCRKIIHFCGLFSVKCEQKETRGNDNSLLGSFMAE
jgi:hypothetical protein